MDKAKAIINFLLEAEEGEEDLWKEVTPDPPEPTDPYDIWIETYRPVQNRIVPDAPFDGMMFETYGPELAFVRAAVQKHVWTYVSGDNNEDIIVAGYHHVNRIGYFITELPWTDGTESFQFGEGDTEEGQDDA